MNLLMISELLGWEYRVSFFFDFYVCGKDRANRGISKSF